MLMRVLFWLYQTGPFTLRIWKQVFSGCTGSPDSKETDFGSSDQEPSPSAGKITVVVLVPCLCMELHPWVSFVSTDEFSVRVTKITSRIGVS